MSTESVDYFALLPEDVIHSQILPKLSTKEAARTCILSTRWRYLWTFMPYLEFYQLHFLRTLSFRNFVDHTIRDRARTETDILRFKLFITHDIQVSDLNNWVRLVMSRNVKEFILHFFTIPFRWPSRNLCMANTITMLELHNVRFSSTNYTITLPHLQTLYFDILWIDQETIEKFISGCPSMRDLKVWSCYDLTYLVVANHPQLKRVSIGKCIRLRTLGLFHVPCLESLTLSLTKSFQTLSRSGLVLDSGAYDTLKELHLCNYSNEENAFQFLLSALTNLECLVLKNVTQSSQFIEISNKNLKRLVMDHCDYIFVAITAPNLTSLTYENNRMLLYLKASCNLKDYIFSHCFSDYEITLDLKSLKFKPVKKFLMNSSNDLCEGTKMIIDLDWCNYTVVIEDWETIVELPYEVVDVLFPKAICISNMSFSQMVEWFLNHSLYFSRKLLVISSADSKFYEVLKEKRPNSYTEFVSFTMNREAFERNIDFSLYSMNNINEENGDKIAFLYALFEAGLSTKQAIILNRL